ncbi:OLC1v1008761C1 [Oldenlandia corymbosa var. corymbosa]|uniref:OLC1v1008761C1 n=1 Tax=Oldenlandia corymbosa var. corymbosa TaxID=529605 RepID=A0AAV1DMP9_OLDCO|nr:OLC1v1008761C1 [Oldenlandia corymbosa var. corymbosa]
MQLATSALFPMVLYTAIKLNLLEIIAKSGPRLTLSPSQIVAQLAMKKPAAASMVDRMLRLLSAHSVLTCDEVAGSGEDGSVHERVYGLTPVGKYFVENEEGFSVSHLVELHNDKVFMESWYELGDAVIEGGIPFNRVHGTHAFDYPSRDPRFNELFNKGMLCTLVDVGGGLGITLHKIISKYPLIKGINFDLPHVVRAAPSYPGMDHVGGDMFECVPGGDAIFMKMILHDWSDDYCLKLLKNCFNALPEGGKVIVVDLILPEKPDSSPSSKGILSTDVLMMTVNPGGKEWSENEVRALAVTLDSETQGWSPVLAF